MGRYGSCKSRLRTVSQETNFSARSPPYSRRRYPRYWEIPGEGGGGENVEAITSLDTAFETYKSIHEEIILECSTEAALDQQTEAYEINPAMTHFSMPQQSWDSSFTWLV